MIGNCTGNFYQFYQIIGNYTDNFTHVLKCKRIRQKATALLTNNQCSETRDCEVVKLETTESKWEVELEVAKFKPEDLKVPTKVPTNSNPRIWRFLKTLQWIFEFNRLYSGGSGRRLGHHIRHPGIVALHSTFWTDCNTVKILTCIFPDGANYWERHILEHKSIIHKALHTAIRWRA